jgi:two-component system response regulator LytT
MKISCVAIDDEPLALDLLSKFIQQTTFLELKGKFSNAIEALGYINQHEVNLIFTSKCLISLAWSLPES